MGCSALYWLVGRPKRRRSGGTIKGRAKAAVAQAMERAGTG